MAAAPSGCSARDQRWEALVSDAQTAFSRVCSVKQLEASAYASNEASISVRRQSAAAAALRCVKFTHIACCACAGCGSPRAAAPSFFQRPTSRH
jgi:hypothetical protein